MISKHIEQTQKRDEFTERAAWNKCMYDPNAQRYDFIPHAAGMHMHMRGPQHSRGCHTQTLSAPVVWGPQTTQR